MKVDLPNLEAEIRKLTQPYEINRIIDVVRAQQKIIRVIQASEAKGAFRVGDTVSASGRGKTIAGTITRIKRTKAIINTPEGNYNVPLSLLQMVRSAA